MQGVEGKDVLDGLPDRTKSKHCPPPRFYRLDSFCRTTLKVLYADRYAVLNRCFKNTSICLLSGTGQAFKRYADTTVLFLIRSFRNRLGKAFQMFTILIYRATNKPCVNEFQSHFPWMILQPDVTFPRVYRSTRDV